MKYTLNIEMPNTFGVSIYCDHMELTESTDPDDSLVNSVEGFIEGKKIFTLRSKKDTQGNVNISIDGI